jgi:hypothetical protein
MMHPTVNLGAKLFEMKPRQVHLMQGASLQATSAGKCLFLFTSPLQFKLSVSWPLTIGLIVGDSFNLSTPLSCLVVILKG